MTRWGQALDLLFPPKCPFCQCILQQASQPVCPACQGLLPWLMGEDMRREVEFTRGCLSPLLYQERVVQAIQRYKFSGVRAYAFPFGTILAQCVQGYYPLEVDGVTWAPLSRKRLRERGYDQTLLLARVVAQVLSLPMVPTLEKLRHTLPQSQLQGDAQRRANSLGAYRLCAGAALKGRKLLLVDDVITSGATMSECARLLREGDVADVWCATLARAKGESSGEMAR